MGKLENFKLFLWNPQTRQSMGRTGDSWLKLIAFYIALYSCLAAIWSLYYSLFHLTISDRYPKWQLDESIIGSNPGVGMRPQSPRQRIESALISYRQGFNGDFKHWVDDLNEYLDELNLATAGASNEPGQEANQTGGAEPERAPLEAGRPAVQVNCNTEKSHQERMETVCPFDSSSIPAECRAAQNFSFATGRPCILIKLNRIYGWRPQPYASRPANYPQGAPFTPGNIQITCEGQHDPDKEHVGEIEYFPAGGIETKYYPFLNQPGYQSPYVMVHFKSPKLNTLIYVECKAWAENVEHERYSRKGMTSFELFIEKSADRI